MNLYYYKNGKPIKNILEWSKLLKDRKYTVIKQETLSDKKWISTVWLGLDHRLIEKRKPLIFETMVFESRKTLEPIDIERYSTFKEAKKGHKEMVKKYSMSKSLPKKSVKKPKKKKK